MGSVESVIANVHFEAGASRPLLMAKLLLFPFILVFLLLHVIANLIASPIFSVMFFIGHQRSRFLSAVPSISLHQLGNWWAFSLLLSDRWPPGAADVRLSFTPLASRFEIFFRPILSMLLFFNLLIFSIPASLALGAQFLHILVFGQRRRGLYEFLAAYWEYCIEVFAYSFHGTDERPLLVPHALRPGNWGGIVA